MHHQFPLYTIRALAIRTTFIVLIEPVWAKLQDAVVFWWRRRRYATQGKEVSACMIMNETDLSPYLPRTMKFEHSPKRVFLPIHSPAPLGGARLAGEDYPE